MQKLEISVRTSQKWNQVQTKSVRSPSSPSYPRLLSVNCWIWKKIGLLDCCRQLSVSWQKLTLAERKVWMTKTRGCKEKGWSSLQRSGNHKLISHCLLHLTDNSLQIISGRKEPIKNPIYAIKISFAWCIQESVAWLKIHWSSIFSKANWFLSQVSPNIPTSQMVADRWQRLHAANSFPNYFEKCYKWFFNICLNQLSWF